MSAISNKVSPFPNYGNLISQNEQLKKWVMESEKIDICFSYYFLSSRSSDKLKGHYTNLDRQDQVKLYKQITDLYYDHSKYDQFNYFVVLIFYKGNSFIKISWE